MVRRGSTVRVRQRASRVCRTFVVPRLGLSGPPSGQGNTEGTPDALQERSMGRPSRGVERTVGARRFRVSDALDRLHVRCESRRVKSCGPSGSQDLAFPPPTSSARGRLAHGCACCRDLVSGRGSCSQQASVPVASRLLLPAIAVPRLLTRSAR